MNDKIRNTINHKLQTAGELFGTLFKWIILSLIIGIAVGGIASVFAILLSSATEFRQGHSWLIFLLPLGGIIIVAMYKFANEDKNSGTNMVMQVVRSDEEFMPGRVASLILVGSLITHFFGGSAGREGAALQFGASVGDWFSRKIKVNESDRKIITLASMSAAFAALLGTPMAAAIFSMEVISVGVMYYSALVPCVFSAFIAQEVSVLLNVRSLTNPYPVSEVPMFYGIAGLKSILLAVCFAIAGIVFCVALHKSEEIYVRLFANKYIRAVAGGCLVILLYLITGTDDYLGLGSDVIADSFITPSGPEMFLMKIVFTCATLCAGYKGGEIVPTFFIGATLGSALSAVVGLPVGLCTACGMTGVFCSVTNSPISSFIIAFELFGGDAMPYYCVVIAVCYLLSGYQSLYREQRIVYSKTENRFINRKHNG